MPARRNDLELINFDQLSELLDPRPFETRLQRNVRRAMDLCGLVAEERIKLDISSGKFKPNAPLTVAMKGSNRPLVDSGELKKSITHLVVAWDQVLVGVLAQRKVRGKDGRADYIANIAQIVHFGTTVKVTERMRRFLARIGYPLNPRTKRIRIPARPFLRSALKASVTKQYKVLWADAIMRSLRGEG